MTDDETEKHWEANLEVLKTISKALDKINMTLFCLVPDSERSELMEDWAIIDKEA